MIEMILSEKGNSDVGERDNRTGAFIPGPITLLTQKLLHFCHKYEVNFHFKPRSELKRYPMTLKGKKRKSKGKATGKGHSDLAYKLGCVAKEENCQVAVLMRDASKHKFQSVYNEIKSGFRSAKFENGIPAVPVPESEAWLICCLDPKESRQIEDSTEDMKILLEKKLSEKHQPHNKETWNEIAAQCAAEDIQAPSFQRYRADMEKVIEYLY